MVWLGRWVFQPSSGSRKCLVLKVTHSFWQARGQHHCLILLLATHGYWRSLGLEKQSALLIYFVLNTYVYDMLRVVATYSYNECNIFYPLLYYLLSLPWAVVWLAFQNLTNSAFSFLLFFCFVLKYPAEDKACHICLQMTLPTPLVCPSFNPS